jgi:hypothetical protein
MTYLKYRSSRGIGLGLLAFLGTSQEEGMNQEGGRKKNNKQIKENQEQMQFIKAKVVICMNAT